MDKPNVFKSSEFYLDQSDVLHVIIKNITGDGVVIALMDKETGVVEDSKIAVSESELYDLQDKDGNYYTVITIGTQEWVVENLHTTTYADGAVIPKLEADVDWAADASGAYCWYDNDQATYENTYGALYNFEAVINPHGLVYFERGGKQDNGWRIPTLTDWYALYHFIDPTAYNAFNSVGGNLKEIGTDHWTAPNFGALDSYGFKGLPSGQRNASGTFMYINEYIWFHSNTQYGVEGSTHFRYYSRLGYADNFLSINYGSKAAGHSVRCMRDVTPIMRDFDGNEYTTVIIGTQEWTVENLNTTHYADGYPITNITDNATWAANTSGALAWHDNDRATYGDTYGALYNWHAVNSSHGLAYFQKNGIKEEGWRIPSKTDFEILVAYLGGWDGAGDKLKEEGTTHWAISVVDTATNEYGFTALPGGRRFQTGSFSWLTQMCVFWTNTIYDGTTAHAYYMEYNDDNLLPFSSLYNVGFSIRCVRDI